MTLAALLARLEGVQGSGRQWAAKCPAHADRENSLSVGMAADGRLLLKCFAGCPTAAVVATLGLRRSVR